MARTRRTRREIAHLGDVRVATGAMQAHHPNPLALDHGRLPGHRFGRHLRAWSLQVIGAIGRVREGVPVSHTRLKCSAFACVGHRFCPSSARKPSKLAESHLLHAMLGLANGWVNHAAIRANRMMHGCRKMVSACKSSFKQARASQLAVHLEHHELQLLVVQCHPAPAGCYAEALRVLEHVHNLPEHFKR